LEKFGVIDASTDFYSTRETVEELAIEEEISVPVPEEKKPEQETTEEAPVDESAEEKVVKEPDVSVVDIPYFLKNHSDILLDQWLLRYSR
jgi:hypothetical protein